MKKEMATYQAIVIQHNPSQKVFPVSANEKSVQSVGDGDMSTTTSMLPNE